LAGWLRDYRLSGFRFDLMGLLDVDTMRAVRRRLRSIKGDVLLYGEGWDMYRGAAMVPASQKSFRFIPDIGMFNDALRDAIKGSTFDAPDPGFIHDGSKAESLRFGIVGAVRHPQVDNARVVGTANRGPWTSRTASSVAYAEIHDNLSLADKNSLASAHSDEGGLAELQRLALGIVILAQGMPVLHAGGEFLRSKEIPQGWLDDILVGKMEVLPDLDWSPDGDRAFSRNSYDLSDEVNAIDWELALTQRDSVEWLRSLIALRRSHPVFRLRNGRDVRRRLRFLECDPGIVAWTIEGGMRGETWGEVLVILSADGPLRALTLPGRDPWQPIIWKGNFAEQEAVTLGAGARIEVLPRNLSLLARPL